MVDNKSNQIHANPEALSRFFYKCNTDPVFRARFIDKPIQALDENGIEVGERAAEQIISHLEILKLKLKADIYLVPVGWENHRWELMEDGWGFLVKGSDRGGIP